MVNALFSETTRDLFVIVGFVLAVIQTILAIKAIRNHAASGSKSNKSLSPPAIILICASWPMINGLIIGLGYFYFGSMANPEIAFSDVPYFVGDIPYWLFSFLLNV